MLHEITSPAPAGSPSAPNLASHVIENARTHPDRVIFRVSRGDQTDSITAAQFHDEVREVAKGLIAQGIQPGEAAPRHVSLTGEPPVSHLGAIFLNLDARQENWLQQVVWRLERGAQRG